MRWRFVLFPAAYADMLIVSRRGRRPPSQSSARSRVRRFTDDMAVVAVGDVHGQIGPLLDLTNKLRPRLSGQDVLIFLGDYIDKGRDVPACVDHIIRLKSEPPCPVITFAGNHEHHTFHTIKHSTY